jgi:Zn-dependent metalloprotease
MAATAQHAKTFPSDLIKVDAAKAKLNPSELLSVTLKLQDNDKLVLLRTETDQLGFVHRKFEQYYKNIKVDGGSFTVHSQHGVAKTLSGSFFKITNLDVSPSISASQAFSKAVEHVSAKVYAWEPSMKKSFPDYKKPSGEVVIVQHPQSGVATLAYKFDIYAAEPLSRAYIYINAKTGELVKSKELIHEANTSISALTKYDGQQSVTGDFTGTLYRLRQSSSGGGVETYSLRNTTNYGSAVDVTSSTTSFTTDPTANQAHFGAEKAYDYFFTKHNRNSYNNAGAKILSYVHYSTNYNNAFWDGSRMTYGDGDGTNYSALVSLDICGHEITHGVTQHSADLDYSYESGALNESFSDIFGEAIEHFAKGSNDWLMGNEIGINRSGAFRSFINPNAYGDPDTYKGTYWYSSTGDQGGVHTNSGVQNKWFYILSNGEAGTNDLGNSYNVTGIGIGDASKIAYRNLTVYLSSTSNYAAARAGAIQAAIDLFGEGSVQVQSTINAWYAVGVGCAFGATCGPTSPVLSASSVAETSAALSWTAATSNVVITGYDVFLNGTLAGSTSALNFFVNNLNPGTTYNIHVVAKDADGLTANSNTVQITTLPASMVTIFGHYFESGWNGWADGGNACSRYGGSRSYEGRYSIELSDNSGIASSMTSPTYNLSPYQKLTVQFYFSANSIEPGEDFWVMYFNGSTWIRVGTFASGSHFLNDRFYKATISFYAPAFASNSQFRIQADASDSKDDVYIDAITVTGYSGDLTGSTSQSIEQVVKTTTNQEQTITGEEITSFSIYPNPTTEFINITALGAVENVVITDIRGATVKAIRSLTMNRIPVADLSKGTYLLHLKVAGKVITRKFVKL